MCSLYKGDTLIAGTSEGKTVVVSGFSVFDCKWSDHLIEDNQWLRADLFAWHLGSDHTIAYNKLVEEYIKGTTETSGGITFKRTASGFKIADVTQESAILNKYNTSGIAWFYILDSTNGRFKLPRTKFGFEGLRNTVGEDIEIVAETSGTKSAGATQMCLYFYSGEDNVKQAEEKAQEAQRLAEAARDKAQTYSIQAKESADSAKDSAARAIGWDINYVDEDCLIFTDKTPSELAKNLNYLEEKRETIVSEMNTIKSSTQDIKTATQGIKESAEESVRGLISQAETVRDQTKAYSAEAEGTLTNVKKSAKEAKDSADLARESAAKAIGWDINYVDEDCLIFTDKTPAEINNNKNYIEEARVAAVESMNATKTANLNSIEQARVAAVKSVNDTKDNNLKTIEQARVAAVKGINDECAAQKTEIIESKNTAVASATAAQGHAEGALEYKNKAQEYMNTASSSATAASDAKVQAQTAATNAGGSATEAASSASEASSSASTANAAMQQTQADVTTCTQQTGLTLGYAKDAESSATASYNSAQEAKEYAERASFGWDIQFDKSTLLFKSLKEAQ